MELMCVSQNRDLLHYNSLRSNLNDFTLYSIQVCRINDYILLILINGSFYFSKKWLFPSFIHIQVIYEIFVSFRFQSELFSYDKFCKSGM